MSDGNGREVPLRERRRLRRQEAGSQKQASAVSESARRLLLVDEFRCKRVRIPQGHNPASVPHLSPLWTALATVNVRAPERSWGRIKPIFLLKKRSVMASCDVSRRLLRRWSWRREWDSNTPFLLRITDIFSTLPTSLPTTLWRGLLGIPDSASSLPTSTHEAKLGDWTRPTSTSRQSGRGKHKPFGAILEKGGWCHLSDDTMCSRGCQFSALIAHNCSFATR